MFNVINRKHIENSQHSKFILDIKSCDIYLSFFSHCRFAILEIYVSYIHVFTRHVYIYRTKQFTYLLSYCVVYKIGEFAVSQPHAPMTSCKSVAGIVRETFNAPPSITSTLPTV